MRTGWHPGDRVLLTDFGLSLMAGDGRCYSLDTGTTAYSPPEMFDVAVRPASLQHVEQSSAGAGYAGDKVDIWSLGAILYVVLKGKHPFGQCPSSFDALDTSGLSNSARDLVAQLLVVVPAERPTLAHIKAHPWLQQSAAKVPETGAAAGPMQVVSSTGSVPSMGLSSANVNSLPSLDSQSAAALDDASGLQLYHCSVMIEDSVAAAVLHLCSCELGLDRVHGVTGGLRTMVLLRLTDASLPLALTPRTPAPLIWQCSIWSVPSALTAW